MTADEVRQQIVDEIASVEAELSTVTVGVDEPSRVVALGNRFSALLWVQRLLDEAGL